jgi:2',3'-cyclic-nucleotide 2'-phosphodiesterase (5'-nucleotidase family)
MKKTFTILHTNDLHSAFIGLGPAADYTPFTLNDDDTRGDGCFPTRSYSGPTVSRC